MKEYKEAEIIVLEFEHEDVIVTSEPFRRGADEMDIFKTKDIQP